MEEKYISEFKKHFTYKLIKSGVEKKELEKVILGKGKYAMHDIPIYTDTNSYLVIVSLHILVHEKKITNKEINDAFTSIEVNLEAIPLLLSYLEDYLIYRKKNNELQLDYNTLLEKIIANEEKFRSLSYYESFISRINKLIKELHGMI